MEAEMSFGVKVQFQEKESVKLNKFDGTNYLRWQDRMSWLLTTLNMYYLLDPTLQPVAAPKDYDPPEVRARLVTEKMKRETDEMVCRGHILNSLTNRLYDVYRTYKTPQEVWRPNISISKEVRIDSLH